MTQDEIIDMWHAANGVKIKGAEYDVVATFARLVARHEREACAQLCEASPEPDGLDLADRIRARGNT
jgi:hypothetical protein